MHYLLIVPQCQINFYRLFANYNAYKYKELLPKQICLENNDALEGYNQHLELFPNYHIVVQAFRTTTLPQPPNFGFIAFPKNFMYIFSKFTCLVMNFKRLQWFV